MEPRFDSFGECLPSCVASANDTHGPMSRWLLHGGIALFWTLVAVVVAARVIYFDPELAARFDNLAAKLWPVFGT